MQFYSVKCCNEVLMTDFEKGPMKLQKIRFLSTEGIQMLHI